MSRFRVKGVAWDGEAWELVPSLRVLAAQIEAADPRRYAVDGTVASKRHDQNSPTSDHTVKEGKVRALDAGGQEAELDALVENLRLSRDPRIKYVIYEGRMFSSYARHGYEPYEWRPYSGSSPHESHFHISTLPEYDDNIRAWSIRDMADHEHPEVPDLTGPGEVFEEDWKWALEEGIMTEYSDPTDGVEKQEFAAHVHRLARKFDEDIDALKARIVALEEGETTCVVEVYLDGERLA